MKWSAVMFRKTEDQNGCEAAQAGRGHHDFSAKALSLLPYPSVICRHDNTGVATHLQRRVAFSPDHLPCLATCPSKANQRFAQIAGRGITGGNDDKRGHHAFFRSTPGA